MSDVAPTHIFTLQNFLKWEGWCPTGGQAKQMIQAGEVRVNGEVETRRGRKLHAGDLVEMEGRSAKVCLPDAET